MKAGLATVVLKTMPAQSKQAAFLPEAKALAEDIAETAAFFYRKDPDASSRRAKCRRWGVVYRETKKAATTPEQKPTA